MFRGKDWLVELKINDSVSCSGLVVWSIFFYKKLVWSGFRAYSRSFSFMFSKVFIMLFVSITSVFIKSLIAGMVIWAIEGGIGGITEEADKVRLYLDYSKWNCCWRICWRLSYLYWSYYCCILCLLMTFIIHLMSSSYDCMLGKE